MVATNMFNQIESLHQQDILWIRKLGQSALAELNARADRVIDDINQSHWESMAVLDYEFDRRMEERELRDAISPFKDVKSWFDSLPEAEKSTWRDLYSEYQYGPDGDRVLDSQSALAWQVMSVLREQDAYLKQPFCPYCDSRGHKAGECMV